GTDVDALACENCGEPVGRPAALPGFVDTRQWLQSDGGPVLVIVERASKVLPIATAGDRGGPDRSTEIEREDLIGGVATKLHCHEREEHGFAGAGRSSDQRVADVADVQ